MALAATSVVACGDDEDETGSGGSGGTGSGGSGNTSSSSSSSNSSSSSSSSTSSGMGGMGGGGSLSCTAGGTGQHTHQLVVPAADVMAGVEQTYTGTGSGHTHPVTVTAQDFMDLQNGMTVTIMTDDTHPHTWTISCA